MTACLVWNMLFVVEVIMALMMELIELKVNAVDSANRVRLC